MQSKSSNDVAISSGDLVEIFIKNPNQKRVHLSSPLVIVDVNHETGSVCMPGGRGRVIEAALEVVLMEISDDCFAQTERETNVVLYRSIDHEVESSHRDDASTTAAVNDEDRARTADNNAPTMSSAFERTFASDEPALINAHHVADITPSATTGGSHAATPHTDVSTKLAIGVKADAFWPLNNELYS